jgi:hypothetical protein
MPNYNVVAKGFMHGRLYDPQGKRRTLNTDMPLKPIPSWLELATEVKAARSVKPVATAPSEHDAALADISFISKTDTVPNQSSIVETL